MPFRMVGRAAWVGVLSAQGKGQFSGGVDMGRPVVTNGEYAALRQASELPFVVVSGVGSMKGVLDRKNIL